VPQWRASNPDLFGYDEAMFHTSQAYAVEDLNMTHLLVTSILPDAKDSDVAIAANILRSRPGSLDEFQTDLKTWRSQAAYHPLLLAVLLMPRADQWVPSQCLHESDDWQTLLDDINLRGFITEDRLTDICEMLSDLSPDLQKSIRMICGVLDRVCTSWTSSAIPKNLNH
jgi:hypothetical protein